MIVYEVNLEIDAEIAESYLQWLAAHMREILQLPGFARSDLFERSDPPGNLERRCLCVQYRVASEADLERYLRVDAPRMRADGEARFGGRFSASRRVLRPLR